MKILILLLLTVCMVSCTSDEIPVTQNKKRLVEITLKGNSPEVFISNQCTTISLRQPHIIRVMEVGDIITAFGYGYTVDNTNNYGAPNVTVIGDITIKIDGKIVKSGTDYLTYKIE